MNKEERKCAFIIMHCSNVVRVYRIKEVESVSLQSRTVYVYLFKNKDRTKMRGLLLKIEY